MTARWWRRNAVALVALAVLVPAGVWAFDQIEGGLVRDAQRDVPAGTSAVMGDWTFGVPSFDPADPSELGAPAGSTALVVRVPVTPGRDEVACMPPTVVDAATGRTWAPWSAADWTPEGQDQSSCVVDSAAPFHLTTLVLLPADAPGDLLVVVPAWRTSDEVRTDLRFEVSR